MAISNETIEQIAAANDIAEVISSYFPLRRSGATLKALCPFHQEKTPSFTVNPQRQTFHCFGCGVGGSVFRFVMDYEHIDFPAAVRKLGERAGIAVIEERRSADEDRQRTMRRALLRLHAEATEWFHENLLKRELGAPAREYLKGRGIRAEIARSWKLGYAPESWDAFSKWAREQGFELRDLLASGLVASRDSDEAADARHSSYDRFRGRLMFPISNDLGEVIAFSGRVLTSEVTAAKYINSPETPLFRKGQVLFGLHRSKRALIEAERAVVCEGQLDLISLFEAGIQNVVAPQGTAFTDQQARLLKRFVREVVLCFDADAAGLKATQRSAEALLSNELTVRVAEMPAGADPDSLVRSEGRTHFEERIGEAAEFFDYCLAKKAGDVRTPGAKLRAAEELAGSVAHVREPILRGEVINKIAARLALRGEDVERLVARASAAPGAGGATEVSCSAPATLAPPHDIAMLCLLALRSKEARCFLLEQHWAELLEKIPGTELLGKILRAEIEPAEAASVAAFETTLSAEEASLVSNWLLQKVPGEPERIAAEWWQGLAQGVLRRELEVAEARLRLPDLTAGEIMQLQKQVLDLREQLREFPRFSPLSQDRPARRV